MSRDLTVVEQQIVTFYDDELLAFQLSDGQIYAAISHMCDALGLYTQGRRLRVVRVDLVPLWLSGVRSSSAREAAVKSTARSTASCTARLALPATISSVARSIGRQVASPR